MKHLFNTWLVAGKLFCFMLAVPAMMTGYSLTAQEAVRIYEEKVTIPTYQLGAPEDDPIFYTGRTYQGAQGREYPYPFLDALAAERDENARYNMVYLENEYIKVGVLPEIGGRVFEGLDKTNGYNFIYKQDVIKPQLIGMLGAWISGGIEFDVPHHHRARAYMPMDYIIKENEDGSKTVWMSELELRHRTKTLIGITLYPGKSLMEAHIRLFNPTPYSHSFLCFANTAVHVNRDYQVIFPPSTAFATTHHKTQMIDWPVGSGTFNQVEYDQVDLSWWKNHPKSQSFFAWNYEDDFFGGYDHGQDAGTISLSNHHLAPGMKFFEWGPGPLDAGDSVEYREQTWNRILTDQAGPYLELMTGAFSDNQPDYSWRAPYETKEVTMFWYPVRDIGGFTYANMNGAINLVPESRNQAKLKMITTSRFDNASLVVSTPEEILLEEQLAIDPGNPYITTLDVTPDRLKRDVQVTLRSGGGEKRMHYQPKSSSEREQPEPVDRFEPPDKIETVEELYLTGLRLQQFHNGRIDPCLYYEEALKRDPENYQVHTMVGLDNLKKGMFEEAEQHFRTAIQRAGNRYTSPRDMEAMYYLGIALNGQGKSRGNYPPFYKDLDDAYDAFYQASWSHAFKTPSYFHLANLDCRQGDYQTALKHIRKCTGKEVDNPLLMNNKAYVLQAAIFRHLDMERQAATLAETVLQVDPLDFHAMNEQYLATLSLGETAKAQEMKKNMHEHMLANKTQTFLEMALDYAYAGFYQEGIKVLSSFIQDFPDDSRYPLIYYYLGYLHAKNGDGNKSRDYFAKAGRMPIDYCFPFRTEMYEVLEAAIQTNPDDARAHYYLGNLYRYHEQVDKAISCWEQAVKSEPGLSTAYRNAGLAYARFKNDLDRGIAYLEKAVQVEANDPRMIAELDVLYEQAREDPDKRLDFLERHAEVLYDWQDDMGYFRMVNIYLQTGHYDKVLDLLANHHFRRWEGGEGVHKEYVDALVLRGRQKMREGLYRKAIADFKLALKYPLNLGNGKYFSGGPEAMVYYHLGEAYKNLGDDMQAGDHYMSAIQSKNPKDEYRITFYKAMSYKALGKMDEATDLMEYLIGEGQELLEGNQGIDMFAKFSFEHEGNDRKALAHFLLGMGHLGKGERKQAVNHLEKSVALDRNNIWAGNLLKEL